MNEDFVSYELALALKACGFNEPCLTFYDTNKEFGRALDTDNFNHLGETYQGEWFTDTISAPSLWQAQKWLREKKELFIEVSPNFGMRARATFGITSYDFTLFDSRGHIINDMDSSTYPSYEAALSAGISAALELIKE